MSEQASAHVNVAGDVGGYRNDGRCGGGSLRRHRSTDLANGQYFDDLRALVEAGFPVFALPAGSKLPRRGSRGVKDATCDMAQVAEWAERWPAANWAVACGGARRLIIADVEGPRGHANDGRATWGNLGIRTRGPAAWTPSGGSHLWFAAPAGVQIANGAGKIGPGVDHRSDGGYALTPSSRTRAGVYRWQVAPWEAELPPLPQVLVDKLAVAPAPVVTVADSGGAPAAVDLVELAARIAAAPIGTRNDTLNRAAYCAGRMVAAGQVDRAAVASALTAAAFTAGLPEREVKETLRSGLEAGLRAGPWSSEAAAAAVALRAWAAAQPWPGRSGSATRRVFVAHTLIAERAARQIYHASVRDVAELAGVESLSTVSLAHRRLAAAGLLEQVDRADKKARKAASFRLRAPVDCAQIEHSTSRERVRERDGASVAQHARPSAALWAREELGPIAGEVYGALTAQPSTIAMIAKTTGRGRRSVERALRILAGPGLAVKVGRGSWVRGAADLEFVADSNGATARAELRRARHGREREDWGAQR